MDKEITTHKEYMRLREMDKLFSQGEHLTWQRLQKELAEKGIKASKSTIFRSLEKLEKMGAPIDVDSAARHFYTDVRFRLPASMTTEDQIKAAMVIKNLMEAQKGTALYDDAMKVLDSLSTVAPLIIDAKGNTLKQSEYNTDINNRVVFVREDEIRNPDIFNTIYKALQENLLLDISVTGIDASSLLDLPPHRQCKENNHPFTFTFACWQLIHKDDYWFVSGFDYSTNAHQIYMLRDIFEAVPSKRSDNHFKLPENFDYRTASPI